MVSKLVQSNNELGLPAIKLERVGRFFGKDYHGGPSKDYYGIIRNGLWLMIAP